MLQAWSEEHNFFLKPLKKKGFKEERVTTMGWYDLGTSHDPGIQQEPPVDVQAFLEASCVLGIHIGLPPIGRTPASQRRMEGFQMIGVNLWSGNGLWGVGMFWIRRLICRPFGTSLMPW